MNNRTSFYTNSTEPTFLDKIRDALSRCASFSMSVSFIKKAGLVLLYKEIEAALARGCRGRIITSTYQNFTDVESLRGFLTLAERYPNFSCHLDFDSLHDNSYTTLGYHSKGYIFDYEEQSEIIIGSSNITRFALLKNVEWNLLTAERRSADTYCRVMVEFEDKWAATEPLTADVIRRYAERLNYAIERWDMDYDLAVARIKPNFMQRRALKELNRYRAMGLGKALVVAAAGSGKTYLAAFDALNFNPGRLLYIVHEGSILEKSLETFQEVFGNSVSFGIYNATHKDLDAQFLFATNLSMSASLEMFAKEHFDYIIIDECHHAVASTYQKIMAYFMPQFILGLTATPDRMDNQGVTELFDQNIPYELRLRDAIINDLIVPFHYYGIRDQLVDYGLTKKDERRMIAQIADEAHCDFIATQIETHRPDGKLKALAFCRNITHARLMCEAMGERYKTAYLTGKNTVGERIRAYNDLQDDSKELEILFTVDILNEGVDIPGVNMVLFLRPTESSTVFIQQLGRGLRKYPNKNYVTVLDFIGNSYKRSVQIAFALGSLSPNLVLEKRLMMSLVKDDFAALGLQNYGVKIEIDVLSKEELVEHLEKENFNSLTYLKQDYENFKRYIHSEFYPTHIDYLNNDCAPDLQRFMSIKIDGRKTCSYYNFLHGIGEEHLPVFTERQIEFVNYLSGMLPLVRADEYMIYQSLIREKKDIIQLIQSIKMSISHFDEISFNHAMKYILQSGFVSGCGGQIGLTVHADDNLIEYIGDLLRYGLTQYFADYRENEQFLLWHSYRIDQVQLKLCKNPGYTMKGTYIYDGVVYIFAGLKKDASTEEHLQYKDKYIRPDLFQWECEAGLNAEKQQELIESKETVVFVRKVAMEHGIQLPFSYVGKGKLTNPRTTDNPKGTLLFDIQMEESLPDYLQYDFGLIDTL